MSEKSMQAGGIGNPFPGLRPFSQEESHLFFGREGQSKSVLESLAANQFVAVIGASGSGKSSLIYCGVIPELLGASGKEWMAVSMRPGTDPIVNLVSAIAEEASEVEEGVQKLRESGSDLEQWAASKMKKDQSLLLVVDQFEEIFRFKDLGVQEDGLKEVEKFVELIHTACNKKNSRVNVVLTMRSDFIGECSIFQELTDLINQSNYLIPQMTREDFRKAIEGPVKVGGAKIDSALVEQLLDEVGIDTDQLPVLQHALMRTWEYWLKQDDPNKAITIEDYEAIGRMSMALSDHANEAYEELSNEQRVLCERVFKTITEKGGDNRGVRRPTMLSKVAEISRCSEEELVGIADVFRSGGRTFLTPFYPVEISSDTVLDISHESLMRIWDRLRLWVDEEASSVQMYNRLSDASEMYQDGSTGLWRPPDLQLALNWREKQKPTATWAVQYNPAFERAMVYLESSDAEFKKEEENKVKLQKRRLRVTRIFSLILGGAAIVALGMFFYARDAQTTAEENEKLAIENEEKALASAEEARIQQLAADSARDEAELQKQLAEEQRIQAEEASALALQRKAQADRSAQDAIEQSEIAEQRRVEAEDAKEAAEAATEEAKKQETSARRQQMLSIAKSMAVKSQQIGKSDDMNLKALLAYQAYKYNLENGGEEHDADIYAGLYDARKLLFGENQNKYMGHSQPVSSIMFLPGDEDVFFTAGTDGKVLKRNFSDAEKQYEIFLDNPELIIKTMNISKDGKFLALGTDFSGIFVYDTENPSASPISLFAHDGHIRGVEFSPDGKFLYSFGMDKEILKWTIENQSYTVAGESSTRVTDISLNPEGSLLAASDMGGNIHLIDVMNPASDTIVSQVDNSLTTLSFSSDGRSLVSGDLNGNVWICDTRTWEMIHRLEGSSDSPIAELCFSPNGKYLASSSLDAKVLVWKMSELNLSPLVMGDNEDFVQTVQFSGDERFVLSGSDILVGRPVLVNMLVDDFCTKINRNMTLEEWEKYVGSGIDYQPTCPMIVIEN